MSVVLLLLLASGVPHGPPIHGDNLSPQPTSVQSATADGHTAVQPLLDTASGGALCASLTAHLPATERTCETSANRSSAGRPPLVIVAGEGKTGTSSVALALAMLGLRAQHNTLVYTCLDGSDGPCTQLRQGSSPHNPFGELTTMPLRDYSSYDYCRNFDFLDSYADTPMSTLTPFIVAANGPGTKVILTVRSPEAWAKRRAGWWRETGWDDAAPFAPFTHGNSPLAESTPTALDVDDRWSARGIHRRSPAALELLYTAQLAMYSCLVPPEDLLVVDVAAESGDAPRLWAKLASFLQRPTTGLNVSHFPRDDPLNCSASEIKEKDALDMSGDLPTCSFY